MNRMQKPTLTALAQSLPASVPFVGPEAQERQMGHPFKARLGANESAFGPSPNAIAAMQKAASEAWMYGDPESYDLRHALAAHHQTHPDSIMDSDTGASVLAIGESSVIDGVAEAVEPEDPSADISSDHYEADAVDLPTSDDGGAVDERDSPPKEVRKRKSMKSARPSNLKELE